MGKRLGRNEKCHCGSGKKFKHCCLSKEKKFSKLIQASTINDELSGFMNLEEKSKALKSIFQEYEFQGLVRAVFSINIYVYNRSALESTLAMNHCVSMINEFGDKPINSYREFLSFFDRIEPILKPTPYDDYILEDFGELKLLYKERYYDVVIGNGFENVYGILQFLDEASTQGGLEKEYKLLLNYVSDQIAYFKDINRRIDVTYKVKFTAPPEELFERTCKYIHNINYDNRFIYIIKLFSADNTEIKNAHFVHKNNVVYPLYNSSILVDFFNQLIIRMTDKQALNTIEFTIYKILSNLTAIESQDSPRLLFPVSIVDEVKFISKHYYTFLLVANDGMILGINRSRFETEDNLTSEICRIQKLHSSDKLIFGEVKSRNTDNGNISIKVPKSCELKILVFDGLRNQDEMSIILKEANLKYSECTSVDLIYFFYFMDDINELFRFIKYEESEKSGQLLTFGGMASNFIMWKESGEVVEKGAIKYSTMLIEHGSADAYVYDYFIQNLSQFPFGYEESFFNVFYRWRIHYQNENDFYVYSDKISGSYGGYVKKFSNNVFLFFAMNIDLFNKPEYSAQLMTNIRLLDDLNMKNSNAYSYFFKSNEFLKGVLLHFIFIPFEKAREEDTTGYTYDQSREFVYSEYLQRGKIISIRYTIEPEKLYRSLIDSRDRYVETRYFMELMSPLSDMCKEEYDLLTESIENDSKLAKKIGVFSIDLEYEYSDRHLGFNISDLSYHLARKKIALICNNSAIEPGNYEGKDATKIVRQMQNKLISHLESEIEKYTAKELHIELTDIYAQMSHEIGIHKKRYSTFSDIDEHEKKKLKEKTIKLREGAKHNIRTVQYMIETNIFLNHNRGAESADRRNIEELLAFSNWLVVLQDTADICYKNKLEKSIKINEDFLVDIVESDEMLAHVNGLSDRVYDDGGYAKKMDEEDKKFLESFEKAFFEDTGLKFKSLLLVLDALRLGYDNLFAKAIGCNVYKMGYESFITELPSHLNDEITQEEAKCALDYLICKPEKLKYWRGEGTDFLPINEREKRDNRFDAKPIVKYDSDLIFSPPIFHELYSKWKWGLLEFYLPYEIGLESSMKVILRWKERYEDLIVQDTVGILKDNGITKIWVEAKLHRLDKKGGHPAKLGDYDVIAIDEQNNQLILIECKYLSLVGSFHEAYMQQYNFFLDDKYDEKFQKRIDYMKEHYRDVLYALDKNKYINLEVSPYMVTNKVFFSRYKNITFQILSINEFRRVVKECEKNTKN